MVDPNDQPLFPAPTTTPDTTPTEAPICPLCRLRPIKWGPRMNDWTQYCGGSHCSNHLRTSEPASSTTTHDCCPGGRSCGKCVRGYLHSNCNVAIGYLRNDPVLLRAGADYLERYEARR